MSDKSVLQVKENKKSTFGAAVKISVKDFGSAKVTCKVKGTDYETQKKVKRKYITNYRVFKYQNPVASFKVGKVDYAKKFNKDAQYFIKKSISGKVSVKAEKGWKISQIRKVNGSLSGGIGDWKKVKNGSKVSLKKGKHALEVVLYNKKEKYYTSVVICPGMTLFNVVAG